MDIEERVARLERKNRNLILAVVFIGGFFWIRQMSPVPSVIEAKSFRVIGGEGQVLAVMGAYSDGDGYVSIANANGRMVVRMSADSGDNSHVMANNAEGEAVAAMGAYSEGDGYVETYNAEGEGVAMMGADSEGDGIVKTRNAKGVWESP